MTAGAQQAAGFLIHSPKVYIHKNHESTVDTVGAKSFMFVLMLQDRQ